jgi:catechol 2,3-dioxygenase-like lactoylglutathione lyase family enzyme
MINESDLSSLQSRVLYTMFRVEDLDRSVAYYQDVLGMNELKH